MLNRLLPRVIPVLLLKGQGLVKGVKFKEHVYIGDPINAVQIFNTKEVDEIVFLDILASQQNRIPDLELLARIADQCLLPFGVGGGIKHVDQARRILSTGAEKVCLCTSALENPNLVREIAQTFGNQSVLVCLDVKKGFFGGYALHTHSGTKSHPGEILEIALQMQELGAGEIMINYIDRDGTREGYDLELIKRLSAHLSIPVIACGGAGSNDDLRAALQQGGASAAAAGSLFVQHGKRKAVLISYPDQVEMQQVRGAH